MPRQEGTERRRAWRLPTDKRLQLRPATIALRGGASRIEAGELEVEFYEGVLTRDPCHEEALRLLGYIYTARGEYHKGLAMDQRLVRLRPDDPTAFYNLACSYSLVGEVENSLAALAKAVRLGYRNVSEMDNDPDLANVRKDARYAALRRRLGRQP